MKTCNYDKNQIQYIAKLRKRKQLDMPSLFLSFILPRRTSSSCDPPVTGHQRRGHGERVKCHKNVAQHLYQLATPAYKLLLAKFWMAWTCKNLASSEFAAAQTNLHKRRSCESLGERISDLAAQKVGQKCSPAKLCVICVGFGALQVGQPERE